MSKYDDQLSRMQYLMDYDNRINENKSSNKIEYHTEGADGKVYGIIKEGTKYYIMTTEKGKENLAESYEYIHGFRYRGENAFTSYNKASKNLEEKMIALNEEYGLHKDVSTVDFDRSKKVLANLTEEARKELDHVKRIMENTNLGITAKVSIDGPVSPEKQGAPFEEKAEAKLDKDMPKSSKTPETANEGLSDKDVHEESLTSDKAPKAPSGEAKDDAEKAKVDSKDMEGTAVASEDPKGGKAVMVNEDITDIDLENDGTIMDDDLTIDQFNDEPEGEIVGIEGEDPVDEPIVGDEEPVIDAPVEDGEPIDDFGAEEDEDLDALMEEFKAIITGDDKTLTGEENKGKAISVDKMGPEKVSESGKNGSEEALKGPNAGGKAISMERLKESKQIDRIIEGVVKKILGKSRVNESLDNKIDRVIKEELGIWGDHPRYRQQPMTLPANKEKIVNNGDKDWNDDSAKGEKPYGEGPGKGDPFNQVVELLTDDVMNRINESLKKKV